MLKRLLPLICCAVLVSDCSPRRRSLLIKNPDTEQPQPQPDNEELAKMHIVLGESFSETLPTNPAAKLNWEVVWDNNLLEGSQAQETLCLTDNNDSCMQVIKYQFKALQTGEATIKFHLKEEDNIIKSFTRHVIVAEDKDQL